MMQSILKFLLLLVIIGGGIWLVKWGPLAPYTSATTVLAAIDTARGQWWLPPVFIAVYAIGGLIAFPGTVLTLVGGAIFGVAWGSLYNWIGANLNALLGFLAARYLGRDFAMKLSRGKLARFDEAAERNGFKTIFYMRLVPLVPFNGINIGSGLAKIRLRDFFLATTIGIIPGCVIYTYFADALIQGSTQARKESFINLAIAAGLIIAISLIPTIIKRRKKRRTSHVARRT